MIHIPIVMATDSRYIPLVVSLTSLLKNAKESTFYDIYILIDNFFEERAGEAIRENLQIFEGQCTLTFINVRNAFERAAVSIPHITRQTYYRLMIPELLQEEKCIYLDIDTIILSDLQELINVPLEDDYVAGVWHPGVILDRWGDSICKNARLSKPDQYINAGVLVMNLELMRRDGLVEKFMELIPENMPTQDQDILNHVCYGKIRFLPFKYNVMTKFADRRMEDYEGCYSEAELEEAWNRPNIIHYANPQKPWNSLECVFTDQWWKFFMKTPLYRMVINAFFEDFVISSIYCSAGTGIFKGKRPALYQWEKKKCVIYGAGKRARDTISYMKNYDVIPEFLVVSDTAGNPLEIDGIAVKAIGDTDLNLKDKTIVIAVGQMLQKEIIRDLLKYEWYELLPLSNNFEVVLDGKNIINEGAWRAFI